MNTSNYYISVLLAIVGLASAQVWLSHLRIETAKHTQLLQAAILKQQEKIQTLGLEYASLARPNRLRQLSHTKLGMQPPQPMQILKP
jgi:cell division protein FtsL